MFINTFASTIDTVNDSRQICLIWLEHLAASHKILQQCKEAKMLDSLPSDAALLPVGWGETANEDLTKETDAAN